MSIIQKSARRSLAPLRQTARRSLAPPQEPLPLSLHRFTVEQYHGMIDAGVFESGDRLELLEGWLVEKMPQNPPHVAALTILSRMLPNKVPNDWTIRVQFPITLADSEPEPDIAVVHGSMQRYLTAHPRPADVALVIEVANTTLDKDRDFKGRIYARAQIPVYWIVNLIERRVEVYTQPKKGKTPAYRERRDYGIDASVPVHIAGKVVGKLAVRDLFP